MPIYTNNIPQPTDDPSQSQNQILENFQVLDAAFTINHGPYNGPNEGKHLQLTMPTKANPAYTYLAGEIGLQVRNALPSSQADIWLTRGAGVTYPMTGYKDGGTNVANGWTYLPSGVLIAWGRATIPAGVLVVTYAAELTNFPGFSTFWGPPQLTLINAAATATNFLYLQAFTQTTFTVRTNAATGAANDVSWMAIGL
jgi:hypothetical protein